MEGKARARQLPLLGSEQLNSQESSSLSQLLQGSAKLLSVRGSECRGWSPQCQAAEGRNQLAGGLKGGGASLPPSFLLSLPSRGPSITQRSRPQGERPREPPAQVSGGGGGCFHPSAAQVSSGPPPRVHLSPSDRVTT